MADRIGRYTVIEKLAIGGMGEVYLARDDSTKTPRTVVVKRLLPQYSGNAKFVEMLFDEARIVASLNHPNIAALYAHGVENGDVFLAMEWVDGKNLARVFERLRDGNAKLPVSMACRIVEHVARALHHAHQAVGAKGQPLELIHRDISPGNIMLGFDGSVKLIDFGVAKAADRLARTAVGIIKGKYPYMSPEQAQGSDIDSRSDLFSLGIVLHELLTMERLFRRKGEFETLEAVQYARIPLPSTLNREVPSGLDSIVLRALARDVRRRFQTAGEFADALHAFAAERGWETTPDHQRLALEGMFQEEPHFFVADEPTINTTAEPKPEPKPRVTLKDCVAKTAPTDGVSGVFFTAVQALAPGLKKKPYKADARYGTAAFLELCFLSAKADDFAPLGAACFDGLLGSKEGAVLKASTEPEVLADALVAVLKRTVAPGARFVTIATAKQLRLTFKREALPIGFFEGFVSCALQRVLGVTAAIEREAETPQSFELVVTWHQGVRAPRR